MKKILIVEDDRVSLQMMSVTLRNQGYNIVSAQDAIGAVATAKRERPDLMVLDINLPGGDALVVIKRLSTMGAMTPIVAVSADASNRQRVLGAGADAFLVKPFDAGALVSAVRGALGEVEAPAPTTPAE
jgi:two-component system OmpR family response regulator